jgi:hypothetical protein
MRVVYGFVVSVKLWAAINCEKGIASCIHIIFFNSTCWASDTCIRLVCMVSSFTGTFSIKVHTNRANILQTWLLLNMTCTWMGTKSFFPSLYEFCM